jgi:hypothetical protein
MKQTIIASSALVAFFCTSLKAQDDNLYVHHGGEVNHHLISPGLDNLGEAAIRKEAREQAKDYADYLAALAAEKEAEKEAVQQAYIRQDLRNQARDEAFRQAALANLGFYHTDPLPLSDQCDNVALIKLYLHDAGYSLTDQQASQLRSYLLTHGLKHLSEIL